MAKVTRRVSEGVLKSAAKLGLAHAFEVALFLIRPHPACPDGEDDGGLVASITIHPPVFPQFAAEGGELRENGGGRWVEPD